MDIKILHHTIGHTNSEKRCDLKTVYFLPNVICKVSSTHELQIQTYIQGPAV